MLDKEDSESFGSLKDGKNREKKSLPLDDRNSENESSLLNDENSENQSSVMDDDSSENEGSLLDDDNSENERLMSNDESGQMGSSVHDESASDKGCKNGKDDSLTEIVKIEECEQGLEDKAHSVYQTAFCSMDKSVVTIDLTTENNEDSSDHFSKGKQPELSQS